MDQSPENPSGNKLGPSINEPSLVRAIQNSGYPLQGIVTAELKTAFSVTEEWGYIDRDTKEHRSLDIFAFKKLPSSDSVHPSVVLLLECKRSICPYVFFRNVIDREIPGFPRVSGWSNTNFILAEEKGNRVSHMVGSAMLGLADLPFVRPGPPHCSTFALAVPKGDKVSMSGSDPYNSLSLPLVKAMDHAATLFKAGEKELYPTLILGIAVIDAPLIVIADPNEATPLLTPWIRVPRQEARPTDPWRAYVYYVFDVVHIDFLRGFISSHLNPLLDEFASRVIQQSSALLKGGGTVKDLDQWRWDEIKPKP
jgi:hypothetical protein